MSSDRLQMIDGSMAKSPNVSGGVVMERESVMKKSMNSVLRVALVTVMALVFGLAGFVSNAEAVSVTYNTEKDTGTTLGAITTNFSEADGVDSVAPKRTTMSVGGTFGASAGDRTVAQNYSGSQELFTIISSTAYAGNTTVTGISHRISLRERTTVADQVQFDLGYVDGAGFNSFGGPVVQSGLTTVTTSYVVDLSTISGVAPAGTYLAIQLIGLNGDGSNELRVYPWEAGEQSQLIVDEYVCADTVPSSITFNATNSAISDFNGADFVNLADISSPEFRITEGAGGASSAGGTGACGQASGLTSPDGVALTTVYDSSGAGLPGEYTESDADSPGAVDTDNNGALTSDCDIDTGGAGTAMTLRDQSGGTYAHIDTGVTNGQGMTSFIMRVYATDDRGDGTCRNGAPISGGLKAYAYNGAQTVDAASEVQFPDSWTAGANTADGCDSGYMDLDLTTMYNGAGGTTDFNVRLWPDTGGDGTRLAQVVEVYVDWSAGSETIMLDWNADPQEAVAAPLVGGNTYNLYARGTDTSDACNGIVYAGGGAAPGTSQSFTWTDCTESATLTLTPITDPITGDVTVTATGTATGIQVGTTPAPSNTSGWVYSPAQDDNTTVVSFYATGTGTCGPLTDSQLNVATNTMTAPTVDAFVIPANVTDTSAPLDVPVTTFTASDNLAVTGYIVTIDDPVAPLAGAGGWTGTAPTVVTVPGYATYTLRAYAKDAAGNVSAASSATVTMSNCVEGGSVTVSITTDPDPSALSVPVTVDANLSGGATNGMVRWREDGGTWTAWVATGATFTPSLKSGGTVDFEAMGDGSCGAGSPVYSATLARTYETRVDGLEPVSQIPSQAGLTSISAYFTYCNDLNGTGFFQVDYKLTSDPDIPANWTNGTPVADNGAGDLNGTSEKVTIQISGLISDEIYDVRMTYIDGTDGVIGTDVYIIVVDLVAWVDNAMLHNSNRFTGTAKHSDNWGKPTGYAGGIMCSTCHEKNPATGNIKRVKETISFPDGSAMPGGGTSAAVTFTSAVDSSSDFGNDSGAPRASSSRICEVCHTFDGTADPAARVNGTIVHAFNQNVVSNHYDNADCIKCHEHKGGFKASCDSCHASPPISNATDLVKDGSTPADATGSVTVGKHVKHANNLSFACNTCHTGWETVGEMPKSGNLNIGFVTPGANGGTYDGRIGGAYTQDGGTGTTVSTLGGQTCAVYCHGYGAPQWTDGGSAVCGACHGQTGGVYGDNRDAAPDGSAGNGGRDLSNLLTGVKVGKHANHLDNSIAETGDPCALCHFGTLYPDATHVDGTVDVLLRQAAVAGDNSTGGAGVSATFSAGTCSNMECHGDMPWDSAAVGGCTLCHDYPPNSGGNHATGVNPVNHDMFSATGVKDNHDNCTYCHGYKDNGSGVLLPLTVVEITALKGDTSIQPSLAGYHNDGSVTMNDNLNATPGDDAGYNAANGGCDTAACHSNDATHQFNGGATTGNTIQQTDIGPGSCGTCHDAGVGGAPVVNATSNHVKVNTATAYGDCTDCHSGHYAAAGGVQIPNDGTMVNYTQPGHGGIKLGGPGTNALISAKTTEAEICWACHDADGISEWGFNTDTNSTNPNFDFGQTYTDSGKATATSAWIVGGVGAWWDSANFAYKAEQIQSTHSVNSAGTSAIAGANYAKTETIDTVANIRCSYCHNVHSGTNGDGATAGAPYLRGTWQGNPYFEDGAPQFYTNNATTLVLFDNNAQYGRVPRGTISEDFFDASSQAKGGYWIDQNMTGQTIPAAFGGGSFNMAGWTLANSAGLCTTCHGSTVNTMDEDLTANHWLGTNGHANAVIGGTGTASGNTTDILDRSANDVGNKGFIIDMGANGNSTLNAGGTPSGDYDRHEFGYRDGGDYTPSYEPMLLGDGGAASEEEPYANGWYEWGASATTMSALDPIYTSFTENQYHKFSCSKCHNPHASRLPKLMITNCLDTNQNTWQDAVATDDGTGSTPPRNQGWQAANWATSQNCHRVGHTGQLGTADGSGDMDGRGWNTVTPW